METKTKINYKGFKPPKIEKDHYFLGGGNAPEIILQENSDWSDYLPENERQSINFETFNCTGFGMLNAIEILMFRLFGEKVNYSDRFLGIMANSKEGNDPHIVCETIRKYGLIPEEMLPWSSDIQNIDEYYSFKGADKNTCLKAGQDWLAKYDFKHEWVFRVDQPIEEKINNIKTALKFSPLGVSVYAWQQDGRGVYVALGEENHWTSQYAQKEFSNILDTYDPFLKLVDQNFSYCKRFHIAKKEPTLRNKLYLTGKKCLGKDMSPTESVYGCVQSLANVFKLAIGQELGENLSTTRLYQSLLKDTRFKQVFEPDLGDIIISPTNGQNRGHTGIVSDKISDTNYKIMSNNSILDIWDEHIDLKTWKIRYASFPILFFRYIIDETLEQQKISILQKIVELYQQIINKLTGK